MHFVDEEPLSPSLNKRIGQIDNGMGSEIAGIGRTIEYMTVIGVKVLLNELQQKCGLSNSFWTLNNDETRIPMDAVHEVLKLVCIYLHNM
jgi:hypothetical protein